MLFPGLGQHNVIALMVVHGVWIDGPVGKNTCWAWFLFQQPCIRLYLRLETPQCPLEQSRRTIEACLPLAQLWDERASMSQQTKQDTKCPPLVSACMHPLTWSTYNGGLWSQVGWVQIQDPPTKDLYHDMGWAHAWDDKTKQSKTVNRKFQAIQALRGTNAIYKQNLPSQQSILGVRWCLAHGR